MNRRAATRSFRGNASLIMALVVLVTSGLLSVVQHQILQRFLDRGVRQSMQLVQDRVMQQMLDADTISWLREQPVEEMARETLAPLAASYDRTGRLPGNLTAFAPGDGKTQLHVIGPDDVVVDSTDPQEIGLDFRAYPAFSAYLDRVRHGGGFSAGRISQSIRSGIMYKYCYYPSRDGRYIFETGTVLEAAGLDAAVPGFHSFAERLPAEYPFVDAVCLYGENGEQYRLSEATPRVCVAEGHRQCFDEAKTTMKPVVCVEGEGLDADRHVFVPYRLKGAEGANEVNVVEIRFNNSLFLSGHRAVMIVTVALQLIGILLAGMFGFLYGGSISRPLTELSQAVAAVAAGDFSVRLHSTRKDEIGQVSRQFEEMARQVAELMAHRDESERQLADKNREILAQRDEITRLYERTVALNTDLQGHLDESRLHFFETVRVLANAVTAKDSYTGSHCDRVMQYALRVGAAMELTQEELEALKFGSILHDIGKIGVPELLLHKEGPLDAEELETIRRHPAIGHGILRNLPYLGRCRNIVLHHHQRVDGKGYPQPADPEEYDLLARIVSVVDAFDAMTSVRPYRYDPLTPLQAVVELRRNAGIQFDPAVVEVFVMTLAGDETLEPTGVRHHTLTYGEGKG